MESEKDFEVFDAAGVALTRGVNIVEASAGTGKTYAIGMLVLRALVELAVPIEKILVVTFTRAATEELKSRIRARIVEARDLLSDTPCENDDATLLSWAARVKNREKAFVRLQLALLDIDRAGIFTIHGFCQRMLTEQALESGQLFDVELVADTRHIISQVGEDFWRSHIYPLASIPCGFLLEKFSTPGELLNSVSQVFSGSGQIEPAVESIEGAIVKLDYAMAQMVEWFRENGTSLHDSFREAIKENCFKKSVAGNFDSWWQSIEGFFTDRSVEIPANIQFLGRVGLMAELNGKKFRGMEKKNTFLLPWPLADSTVAELLTAVADFLLAVRVHLAEEIRREVGLRLERQGTMGFNDLVLQLAAALDGTRGRSLIDVLSARYNMALIDEFQDTDAAQYHIFSTLFGGGAHYLYLIGDPKQAIYRFRGADIHSYFMARESAQKLLTLEKNYRSHPALVQEVNHLFSTHRNPFRLGEEILEYHEVKCGVAGADSNLFLAGESLAAMVYCSLQVNAEDKKGRWSSGKAATQLMNFIVYEIGRLLNHEDPAVLHKKDDKRSLKPSEIAILVRSRSQARMYKQALIESGIPAVVGSNSSVFETLECREMYMLIQAVAMVQETMRIKSAMTISWFGLTGNDLQQIWQDEALFSDWHNRFFVYNRIWQERGFLVMIKKLLDRESVFVTLAGQKFAERSIANILHLQELIGQQENDENYGLSQTLQWIEQMMQDDSKNDNSELLLESDEEAVRIITMHGSKGLEYPVVFCPYLWYRINRLKNEKYQISCYTDTQQLVVDLGSPCFDARRLLAIEEEMAEEMRLLYVALTRAAVRCYILWADIKPSGIVADSFQSSLGYLLFPEGYVGSEEQEKCFEKFKKHNSVEILEISAEEYPRQPVYTTPLKELRALPESGRSLHTHWQMSSYSAMAALSEYEHDNVPLQKNKGDSSSIAVTGLPAGPGFGNVIHDILESVSFYLISRGEKYRDVLTLKCNRYGIVAEPADIEKLLKNVVTTVLPTHGKNFSLAELVEEKCLKEMDFYFRLGRLETGLINDILADEPTVTPLSPRVMEGYLTGFADLVCQHEDKYYIFDYKTNYLGESMVDYGQDRLVAAMQSHNYGLQYWIYTLVLHRHLQNMIPKYEYQRHFGGVMYLFLRGMSPLYPGAGVYFSLPDYRTLKKLDYAMRGERDD